MVQAWQVGAAAIVCGVIVVLGILADVVWKSPRLDEEVKAAQLQVPNSANQDHKEGRAAMS